MATSSDSPLALLQLRQHSTASKVSIKAVEEQYVPLFGCGISLSTLSGSMGPSNFPLLLIVFVIVVIIICVAFVCGCAYEGKKYDPSRGLEIRPRIFVVGEAELARNKLGHAHSAPWPPWMSFWSWRRLRLHLRRLLPRRPGASLSSPSTSTHQTGEALGLHAVHVLDMAIEGGRGGANSY